MLETYRHHVAERAEQGLPPLALNAEQTAALVELLKSPPAGEAAFLLDLISQRVPAGVDEAAYVKAGFLAAIARGASFLMLEPLARGVAPWWDEWVEALGPHGVVAGDYKFDVDLPARLAEFSESAGFNNRVLSARVMWVASR